MFCTNCGENQPEGTQFCTSCGKKMTPMSSTPQPAPTAPVAPTPVTPVAPVAPTPMAAQPVQPTPAAPVAPAPMAAQPVPTPAVPVAPVAPTPMAAQPVQPTPAVPVAPTPMAAQPPGQPVPGQPVPGQPVAPAPGQPTAPAQPKKKKNLGLILGLALGIPTLLIVIAVVVIVAVIYPKIANSGESIGQSKEDDDDDQNKPEPDDIEDPKPEPDNGGVVEPETDPVVEEIATRTIMIYIVGSNLESPNEYGVRGGAATNDIYEMLAANIPDDVKVVLECGGAEEWVYPTVPDGVVSRHVIENNELVLLENLGRDTMTEYGDLTDFINFASDNYPAEKYSLVLWNHGGGIPISFGIDQLGDESSMLTDVEISEEIRNSNVDFDSVIFDACNMCTLEVGMALHDHSDYMVGAESYVNGIGIYYTNWLGESNGDVRDFCETIVEDYMDSLKENNLVGSMSVIRLDRINEVYTAYKDYISSVYDRMYAGYEHDFSGYIKARSNCGEYYGTDSVDLTTLANKYETSKSSALINAVSNAVVYTQSDMPYGHGITAYSPSSDYFHYYNKGRVSLDELDYSSIILDFYDHLVSEMLSYYGADAVAAYGGDWFISDYDIADAGSSNDIGKLDVYERSGYYGVGFTSEFEATISTVATAVVVNSSDGSGHVLGQDFQCKYDSDGYIALADPEYWYWINDNIATFYATSDYYDDYTDEWSRTGYIPVTVNGETAALYIYFDQNNPSGLILGYYYFNYDTLSRDDNTMYYITDDLVFDLYYPFLDENQEPYYYSAGNPFYGDEINLQMYYINLDEFTTYGYIEIIDVYGNKYQTELYYFCSRDVVQ